ncbi:hypothetical protein EYR40_000421 [Pleurotus pulmonarius]|nr:hypothetical protein EYR36_001222 [Pleurotus pulmonarius]KAF4603259.1 hypothetical protein EYR38_003671 [Pleurotus pulmonarius]KAF4608078.1 hypothetical protein EYR40_000421 [Pleurotus pulmonarius]
MALDSSGFSDVGRYGTVYLMKKQDPATPVTAFPLDDDETTFGRDQSCSIRLYYPQVSPIHGKIYFEDRKAYLVVLGAGGLLVDGCKVLPTTAGTSSHHSPRTIPLTNNTEIEIHSKRFKFTYPPKELRAALLATPAKTTQTPHRRRALRLSMIQSAQVFTPRPSPDPRENLRILQSPLRPFSSPKKPSPLQTPSSQEEEEEEIVLVDGNHPRVVEDEKDLIILEDVEVEINDVEQSHPRDVPMLAPAPQSRNPPPQTPQRRARPSLHKAVLIRSAQRAVMKAEIEREEEEEIQEVEEFATQTQSGSEESSSEEEDEDEVEEETEPQGMTPTWRKGLDAVQRTLWPFGREPETGGLDEDHDEPQTDEVKQLETDHEPPRAYGNFMTPQVHRRAGISDAGRLSMGGEARRVLVEQKWRVKDIEVPPPVQEIKEEDPILDGGLSTPLGSRGRGRDRLSEEERKAIQERRRSALRTPDPFFGGQTPGIRHFPGFPASPTKPTSNPSPTKLYSPMKSIPEPKEEEEEEEDLDTRSLLEKMKETVAEMKRRRSMAPVGPAPGTPDRKNPAVGMTPGKRAPPTGGDRRFSLLAPAAREEIFGNEEDDEATGPGDLSDEEMDDDKENAITEPVPIPSGTPANPLRLAPKTPKMDGLRHMFAAPKPVPPTPSFIGVRDMFKTREAPRVATPVYEGIGELIQTPVYEEPPTIIDLETTDEAANPEEGSREKQPDEEPVIEDDTPEVEEKPKAAPKTKLVKPTRISKRSTRNAATKDTPSLADDEATPGSHEGGKGDDLSEPEEDDVDRLRHSKRLPRPRKVDEPRQVPAAPSKLTRTRQHSGDKSEGSSSGLKPRSQSKVAATRAAINDVVQPVVQPRRKATTPEEPSSSEVTESAPKRRARKPTSKVDEPNDPTAEEHPPSSLPKATRKGRSATKSNADTDPPSTANEAENVIAPKRRAPPRTRARDVIKEEDTEDSDLAKIVEPLPKRRVGRPVAASKLASRAGPSSQKATPNAPSGTGKENTPGTGDDEEDLPEKATKPKVSRTKKVVKEEVVEEAPKRTRITRARMKT